MNHIKYQNVNNSFFSQVANKTELTTGGDYHLYVGPAYLKTFDLPLSIKNKEQFLDNLKTIHSYSSPPIGSGNYQLIVQGNRIEMAQRYSISTAENKTEVIGKKNQLEIGQNQTTVVGRDFHEVIGKIKSIKAGENIHLIAGKSKILLSSNGEILIEGLTIKLKANKINLN